ncbi:MAG: hypothetical protein R3B91_10410 [Planctomycetaceae bacterium]
MSTDVTETEPPRRSWVTGKRLIGIAITVLVVLRIGVDLMPIRLQIGPETSYIDGPLRADGTPDYAAYLNEQWSAGVAPDENAAVDLIHAFGPGIINEDIREDYFQQLGIEMPPLEGDYYVDFYEFMEQDGSDWCTNPKMSERINVAMEVHTHPWSPNEHPDVAQWLDANRKPLATMLTASSKSHFFSPMIPPDGKCLLDSLLDITDKSRTAARLIMANAMRELEQGNIDIALDHTLDCHRLSRLVSRHQALIGSITAHNNSKHAIGGDEQIILSGRLTTLQADNHRQRLSLLPAFHPISDIIDKGERFNSLDLVAGMHDGRFQFDDENSGLAMRWGLDPNEAMRQFNEHYDEIHIAMQEPDLSTRLRDLNAIWERRETKMLTDEIDKAHALLFGLRSALKESAANIVVLFTAPAVDRVVIAEEESKLRMQLVDTGYALAEYRAETGSFPDSLESLVPEQLDELPIDPYSDELYRYKRTDGGFLLWSVGPDGFDDGGKDHSGFDDIPFGDRPSDEE